jgi:hypothetical protein
MTRAVAAQTAMRALHRAHAHGTAVRVHDTDFAGVCFRSGLHGFSSFPFPVFLFFLI